MYEHPLTKTQVVAIKDLASLAYDVQEGRAQVHELVSRTQSLSVELYLAGDEPREYLADIVAARYHWIEEDVENQQRLWAHQQFTYNPGQFAKFLEEVASCGDPEACSRRRQLCASISARSRFEHGLTNKALSRRLAAAPR